MLTNELYSFLPTTQVAGASTSLRGTENNKVELFEYHPLKLYNVPEIHLILLGYLNCTWVPSQSPYIASELPQFKFNSIQK